MEKTLKRNLQINTVQKHQQNTITFSCASSAPYLRTDEDFSYYEILEISEKSIDFQRLVDCKSPLLFEHNTEKQIRCGSTRMDIESKTLRNCKVL